MFKDVLSDSQLKFLGLIQQFRQDFYLAGGTAIALQIGHRRSIDFDLFRSNPMDTMKIIRILKKNNCKIDATLEETSEELTMIINGVKITFLEYPFDIKPSVTLDDIIIMPDLLTLATMKAYSLGRRSKWKDYVDLYFMLRDFFTIKEISQKAKEIFGGGFNERLFREQLCYFDGIDFSETIDYMEKAVEIDDKAIKTFLVSIVTEI